MQTPSPEEFNSDSTRQGDLQLGRILTHLSTTLERDHLVVQVTSDLQQQLGVDRVALYYFYRQWKGQVTFEALSDPKFSILSSTGPDEWGAN